MLVILIRTGFFLLRCPDRSLLHRPDPRGQSVRIVRRRNHSRKEGRRDQVALRRSAGRGQELWSESCREECGRGEFDYHQKGLFNTYFRTVKIFSSTENAAFQ